MHVYVHTYAVKILKKNSISFIFTQFSTNLGPLWLKVTDASCEFGPILFKSNGHCLIHILRMNTQDKFQKMILLGHIRQMIASSF